jgi:hypothetical protein
VKTSGDMGVGEGPPADVRGLKPGFHACPPEEGGAAFWRCIVRKVERAVLRKC